MQNDLFVFATSIHIFSWIVDVFRRYLQYRTLQNKQVIWEINPNKLDFKN